MPSDATSPPVLAVGVTCFNNEGTLGRVLASVRELGDRLPIVVLCMDSGSTDGTHAIIQEFGAERIDQPFLGYVKQKQALLERCCATGAAWTMHLDSDESLEPALIDAIAKALEDRDTMTVGLSINRRVWYAGRMLNYAWQPEYRLRIARSGCAAWGGEDPHDKLELTAPGGIVEKLDGVCRHDSIEDIASFLARQARFGRIAAASAHARGKRTSAVRLLTSPIGALAKQLVLRKAVLDGWRGVVAAGATAFAAFAKHAALLEIQKKDGTP